MVKARTTNEAIEMVRGGEDTVRIKGHKVDLCAVRVYLQSVTGRTVWSVQTGDDSFVMGVWGTAKDPLNRVLDTGESDPNGPDYDALVEAIQLGFALSREGLEGHPDDILGRLDINWDQFPDTVWGEALFAAESESFVDFDESDIDQYAACQRGALWHALDFIRTARDEAAFLDSI